MLVRTGSQHAEEEDETAGDAEDESEEAEASSGSKVRLKPWNQRFRKNLGLDSENRTAPLIDQAHCRPQLLHHHNKSLEHLSLKLICVRIRFRTLPIKSENSRKPQPDWISISFCEFN